MSISVNIDVASAEAFAQRFEAVHRNVSSVIKGKPGEIQLCLTSMLAEGHILVDDVPGTGKTTLAKSLAQSIEGTWSRIQFTPDLLPTDITGSMVFRKGDFEFHEGGVFANVVLADEINRASPKTQSALLEVMEERQVSMDKLTHKVPQPFVVIATQNPVEFDGTYRLPEAQLDRFMVKMSIGYPDHSNEVDALSDRLAGHRPEDLSAVISVDEFSWMIDTAKGVYVADALKDYAVTICRTTRTMSDAVKLGVSTRGVISLVRMCQAWAAARGRNFVSADDLKRLAPFVLSHRLKLTAEAELQGYEPDDLIAQVLDSIPVPTVRN